MSSTPLMVAHPELKEHVSEFYASAWTSSCLCLEHVQNSSIKEHGPAAWGLEQCRWRWRLTTWSWREEGIQMGRSRITTLEIEREQGRRPAWKGSGEQEDEREGGVPTAGGQQGGSQGRRDPREDRWRAAGSESRAIAGSRSEDL